MPPFFGSVPCVPFAPDLRSRLVAPTASGFDDGAEPFVLLALGLLALLDELPQAASTTAELATRATPRATFLEMSMLILSG